MLDKHLIIVSGRSGAGKSVALDQLEDYGYYCVDNIPAVLLGSLLDTTLHSGQAIYSKMALAFDVRNLTGDIDKVFEIIKRCSDDATIDFDAIFLDASDDVLVARFKETKRIHPLSNHNTDLYIALARESSLLEELIEQATVHIDTTNKTALALREEISGLYNKDQASAAATLSFCSFGFKKGLYRSADILFDVRCLPNPYWDPKLRLLNGCDEAIVQFFAKHSLVEDMYKDIASYLKKWLPHFISAKRHYITVAIGCTGGQHRSVYFCERLFRDFNGKYAGVRKSHRDMHV